MIGAVMKRKHITLLLLLFAFALSMIVTFQLGSASATVCIFMIGLLFDAYLTHPAIDAKQRLIDAYAAEVAALNQTVASLKQTLTSSILSVFCDRCLKVTDHKHLYNTVLSPNGVDVYVAGSERYECSSCSHGIYVNEGVKRRLKFVFDKPDAERWVS